MGHFSLVLLVSHLPLPDFVLDIVFNSADKFSFFYFLLADSSLHCKIKSIFSIPSFLFFFLFGNVEIATALDSCYPICHYLVLEVILECCVPLPVEHCVTIVPRVVHLKVGMT